MELVVSPLKFADVLAALLVDRVRHHLESMEVLRDFLMKVDKSYWWSGVLEFCLSNVGASLITTS